MRITTKASLVLALVFCLGSIAGAAGAWAFTLRTILADLQGSPEQRDLRRKQLLLRQLERRLDLDPAQRSAIESVLDRQMSATAALRAELEPRISGMRLETERRIHDLLRDEQQVVFAREVARFEANRAASRP